MMLVFLLPRCARAAVSSVAELSSAVGT